MPWSSHLQPVRAKCGAFFVFLSPPLGKGLNIIEEYEGLSLVDASFAPRNSPRPLKKKKMVIGRGGGSMIRNINYFD